MTEQRWHILNLYNRTTMNTYTVDAQNKKIGRVASEAARALLGKTTPAFSKNKVADITVVIKNASKTDISHAKKQTKSYDRYSGYPGGLRFESLDKILREKGYEEVYRRAIKGMLPANRLRSEIMKNLKVTD